MFLQVEFIHCTIFSTCRPSLRWQSDDGEMQALLMPMITFCVASLPWGQYSTATAMLLLKRRVWSTVLGSCVSEQPPAHSPRLAMLKPGYCVRSISDAATLRTQLGWLVVQQSTWRKLLACIKSPRTHQSSTHKWHTMVSAEIASEDSFGWRHCSTPGYLTNTEDRPCRLRMRPVKCLRWSLMIARLTFSISSTCHTVLGLLKMSQHIPSKSASSAWTACASALMLLLSPNAIWHSHSIEDYVRGVQT